MTSPFCFPTLRKMLVSLALPTVALGLTRADDLQLPTPKAIATTPSSKETQPAVVAGPLLNLAQCLQIAHQHHPRLAAHQASLAAAVDAQHALAALKVPAFIVPELPVRLHQSTIGLEAPAARLKQTEREVTYAVTRTYFTILFAREQERLAKDIVGSLSAIRETAQGQLKGGARDVTENDVNRTLVVLRLAELQQIKAAQGVKRALAALGEAMGIAPHYCFDVAPGQLAAPEHQLCKGDIVAAALARRGERIQAEVFARVAGLEVEAQGKSQRKRMETFASGSDIHGQIVPPGRNDTEYQPAGVPPEMPTNLAGARCDRVQIAQDYQARAWAVLEETTNLIALEAADAFLRWEEASLQAPKAKEAAEAGTKVSTSLRSDLSSGARVKVEEVVNGLILSSQARAQYNQTLYNQILALADLERITGGAFCAGLVASSSQAPPAKKDDAGNEKKKDKGLFDDDKSAPDGKKKDKGLFDDDKPGADSKKKDKGLFDSDPKQK